MEHTIALCPENEQILEVHFSGNYDYDQTICVMDEIAAECGNREIHRVLLDLTELDDIPDMDRYRLAMYSTKIWRFPIRLGATARPEKINRFFETVAKNRGVQIKVDPNREVVIEYLSNPL